MRIDETTYKKMPAELQALFVKLPNYGSQEVMELFPDTKTGGVSRLTNNKQQSNINLGGGYTPIREPDSGSAARFFYCAKSSRRERDAGLEDMTEREVKSGAGLGARRCSNCGGWEDASGHPKCTCLNSRLVKVVRTNKNNHPTVKPLALMSYLCKLVKMPEYNLILDPFCGSGTTLLACKKLGIPSIGIDSNEKYCEIASKRCNALQE